MDEATIRGQVAKVDEAKRLVFGWASVVEEAGKELTDLQGDVISEDTMEKMAYDFVLKSRVGGVMHQEVGVATLVESIALTKEKQEALGIDIGKVAWWVGFKVHDDDVWESVEDGTLSMFSIHGLGQRVEIDEE